MRRLYAPGSDSSQTCAHIRTAEDIFHRLPKFSYERMPEIRAGGKKKPAKIRAVQETVYSVHLITARDISPR